MDMPTTPTPDASNDRPAAQRSAVKPSRGPARGASTMAAIHRSLRAEIVEMRRNPGEPIVEKHIAEAFGVSRTPVREALQRLADEGLIEIFPQVGTFVARIPVNALPEAIVIRTSLEGTAVRYAAQRATGSQIAGLRANLLFQQETVEDGDLDAFHEADERFHALIAEIAGYPGLWSMAQQVKVQVDRYRRLTLPEPGRLTNVLAEHAAIVDAIADADPALAADRMAVHLDGLLTSIPQAQGANPFFFTGP
ncbi:GntR family transcriptional regulator [Azospirillum formosense]|uniref:GntR family transcriptional regulator n=1 Tax=Azospirillum formosense TaxID=861533 RepID=UPI00338F92F4